jgi:hypothetical protein
MPVETVVMAIGQSPNPTFQRETPQLVTKRGKIVVDDRSTSLPRVYAGGDVVRGGSTVILAMRDGRAAAEAIDRLLREKFPEAFRRHTAVRRDGVPAILAPPEFRVSTRRRLTPDISWLEMHAPAIAAHWKPGQFVIVRPTPSSERIPLTLVEGDAQRGTIDTLVVQAIGKTSRD